MKADGRVMDSVSQLLGRSEGDRVLPHWVVSDELARSDDIKDIPAACAASDTVPSSRSSASLSGSATRTSADESVPLTNAISQDTAQSQDGSSSDPATNGTSIPSKPDHLAMWGSVQPFIVRSSITDSSVGLESGKIAESISAESFYSVCEELDNVVDQPNVQVLPCRLDVSYPGTSSISHPKASDKLDKKVLSVRDGDNILADQPFLAEMSAACDLADIVFEDEQRSEKVSLSDVVNRRTEQLQKPTAFQSVSHESVEVEEQRHIHFIDSQHISKETAAVDERHHVKMVADQFVGLETTEVDERMHLRMSSLASATTETEEVPQHASVKLVEGRQISAETISENAVRPCIQVHPEHCAAKQTETRVVSTVCYFPLFRLEYSWV